MLGTAPYLLPLELLSFPNQLNQEPRPLQVVPELLPVFQLFLHCTRLLVLLSLWEARGAGAGGLLAAQSPLPVPAPAGFGRQESCPLDPGSLPGTFLRPKPSDTVFSLQHSKAAAEGAGTLSSHPLGTPRSAVAVGAARNFRRKLIDTSGVERILP